MQCPRCKQENPPRARFCNSCGAHLELVCSACNQANSPGGCFCNGCDQALGETKSSGPARFAASQSYTRITSPRRSRALAPRSKTRKQVTVLFADLQGLDATTTTVRTAAWRAYRRPSFGMAEPRLQFARGWWPRGPHSGRAAPDPILTS
jgi:hypothetical protein